MSNHKQKGDDCKVIWETFSEDEFPYCSLLAISKAVCDFGEKSDCILDFDEVRRKLLESITLKQPSSATSGWYPMDFDGINLPLVTFGTGTDREYGNLDIKVSKVLSSSFQFEEEYVLMDHRRSQQQCMKVICKMKQDDIKYYLCRRSTSVVQKRSVEKIPESTRHLHQDKNEIDLYIVRVKFRKGFDESAQNF